MPSHVQTVQRVGAPSAQDQSVRLHTVVEEGLEVRTDFLQLSLDFMQGFPLVLAADAVRQEEPAQPGRQFGVYGPLVDRVVFDGPVEVILETGSFPLDSLEEFNQKVRFVAGDFAAVAELAAQGVEFGALDFSVLQNGFDELSLFAHDHEESSVQIL